MKNYIERREFLKYLGGITAGVFASHPLAYGKKDRLGKMLPTRQLGSTGMQVTMLGLGGYHIGWTTEKDAAETIDVAINGGIRFFDTAESYGPHTSEVRYGKYLVPKYRDDVFIMTKSQAKDAKTAQEHLEGSLRRMDCDYLDLWQIHSISSPQDVEERLNNGVLEVFMKAKADGKVKHIGFTGHADPAAHAHMLTMTAGEKPFATCQMPINIVDAAYDKSFIETVMPSLIENNIGALAMKTLADGRFFPKKVMNGKTRWQTKDPVIPKRVSVAEALNFAWSLPVSVLITGAEKADMLKEKIKLAKKFVEMDEEQRQALITKVGDLAAGQEVEYYKKV